MVGVVVISLVFSVLFYLGLLPALRFGQAVEFVKDRGFWILLEVGKEGEIAGGCVICHARGGGAGKSMMRSGACCRLIFLESVVHLELYIMEESLRGEEIAVCVHIG